MAGETYELENDPQEKRWMKLEWTELALRRQLALLKVTLPAHLVEGAPELEWPDGLTVSPTKRELANLLYEKMKSFLARLRF